MAGKGPQGEETLYLLQQRGSMTRVVPKGGKRGTKGGGKGGKAENAGGKNGPQWDPKGCARCGRGGHWARECKAVKDIYGNPPKEKPRKKAP